jgi:hypothetical protein
MKTPFEKIRSIVPSGTKPAKRVGRSANLRRAISSEHVEWSTPSTDSAQRNSKKNGVAVPVPQPKSSTARGREPRPARRRASQVMRPRAK